MRHALLAAFVVLPVAARAQAAARNHWSVDVAAGFGFGWTQQDAHGPSYAVAVGHTLSRRVTLRVATELSSVRTNTICVGPVYPVDDPSIDNQLYCTAGYGQTVVSLSVGADAALSNPDRGLYLSTRLGVYSLGSSSWLQGGAYVGTGFAFPFSFGAVTLEAGLHGFFGAPRPGEGWVVPVRFGLRWRP